MVAAIVVFFVSGAEKRNAAEATNIPASVPDKSP
jgi:hypothetical protein